VQQNDHGYTTMCNICTAPAEEGSQDVVQSHHMQLNNAGIAGHSGVCSNEGAMGKRTSPGGQVQGSAGYGSSAGVLAGCSPDPRLPLPDGVA
jgi:hypothetical protein